MTQLIQASTLTTRARGRVDRGVLTDSTIDRLLAADAPVAIGVSGGKDSTALAFAAIAHLDAIGHRGPRVLIHSDLGRVEWRESLPLCERLAARLGLELLVVRREAGDMMDRWLTRWDNNLTRYRDLSCVKVILPWSTPSMRFCTSELKVAIICRALTKRFPGRTIVSASGIRRDESSARSKAPISHEQPKLTSKTHRTTGLDWHPILHWTLGDVITSHEYLGFALHEAYTRYGMSRVSCAYCIMSNTADLKASTTCPDNADLYREMVDLEIASTFAFQGAKWLGDVAPHLLNEQQREALRLAKRRAEIREAIEARVPTHLLYTKGWPHVLPTQAEAVMLAEVRREVAGALGITVGYTTPEAILLRYEYLMAENADDDATMRRTGRQLRALGEVVS
jgi:3'-phosphoadenosine 5'-phosphosulfate sulfotransferase (PAPS reductase)/FAD synthetase